MVLLLAVFSERCYPLHVQNSGLPLTVGRIDVTQPVHTDVLTSAASA